MSIVSVRFCIFLIKIKKILRIMPRISPRPVIFEREKEKAAASAAAPI